MNFTWFGNFVMDLLMKDIHKRCRNKRNQEFVEALVNLSSKTVSTLIFTILITGLIADVNFGNNHEDHMFAAIFMVLGFIAFFIVLFIVISIMSNYPIQDNNKTENMDKFVTVTVSVGDYQGKCCLDKDDAYCCMASEVKNFCKNESKWLVVFAVFAVFCSLLIKCVPHVLGLPYFRLSSELSEIVAATDLVLSIAVATCNIEIFAIGLLSSCFALYGVIEESLVKEDKFHILSNLIRFGFIVVSLIIIFFYSNRYTAACN